MYGGSTPQLVSARLTLRGLCAVGVALFHTAKRNGPALLEGQVRRAGDEFWEAFW